MAGCPDFDVTFTGSASDLFTKLQNTITGAGGTVAGDASSGSISVDGVVGTYTINGQVATVSISAKPFFLPCSTIENIVTKAIG